MSNHFVASMRQAVLATRSQKVIEATRIIRDVLSGRTPVAGEATAAGDTRQKNNADPLLTQSEESIEEGVGEPTRVLSVAPTTIGISQVSLNGSPRMRKPLGEVLKILRTSPLSALKPNLGPNVRGMTARTLAVADGAQFLLRSFTCPAGTRSYKLYIPSSDSANPRGLLVMLHGCKQDPDDFAAGTKMNAVAEAHNLVVAYPSQANTANPSSCWNWFNPADQMRDAGEPAILAGLTRELMSEFGLDRDRVFIAGLSAGGAMAAVMAETYPDLYAAVGVHSGLAYGSANDLMSALIAMRGDAMPLHSNRRAARPGRQRVRTIVFQGRADQTVHPSNADRIFAAASAHVVSESGRRDYSRSVGGRALTQTIVAGTDGSSVAEYWLIEDAGHAWAGGDPSGSFTDHRGPDASAEMVRFFLNPSYSALPR